MLPAHNLATEMNSFRMLAGMRTLNWTFIGIYVDFIRMGWGWNICHISCSSFPTHPQHAFIPKANLRRKDLSTDSRQDTAHCTYWPRKKCKVYDNLRHSCTRPNITVSRISGLQKLELDKGVSFMPRPTLPQLKKSLVQTSKRSVGIQSRPRWPGPNFYLKSSRNRTIPRLSSE